MRRIPSLAILSFVIVLLVQAQAGPLSAVEAVRLRGGLHSEFGRIVFDWATPVPYQARIEGERLIVRFERSAAFDARRAERMLPAYIGSAQVGADGQEIAFPLKGTFKLKHFALDKRVVVDLYQASDGDVAAAEPEAVQAKAESTTARPKAVPGRPGQDSGKARQAAEAVEPESRPRRSESSEDSRQKLLSARPSRTAETDVATVGAQDEPIEVARRRAQRGRIPPRAEVGGAPTSILPPTLAGENDKADETLQADGTADPQRTRAEAPDTPKTEGTAPGGKRPATAAAVAPRPPAHRDRVPPATKRPEMQATEALKPAQPGPSDGASARPQRAAASGPGRTGEGEARPEAVVMSGGRLQVIRQPLTAQHMGQMPLLVELYDADNTLIDSRRRDH